MKGRGEAVERVEEEVLKHDWRDAGGVGAEKDEERCRGQKLAAEGEGLGEVAFDLVDLALRAAPEGGRVEDDGVVAPSATDFASEELVGVLGDPADRGILESVQRGVFARPVDHAL